MHGSLAISLGGPDIENCLSGSARWKTEWEHFNGDISTDILSLEPRKGRPVLRSQWWKMQFSEPPAKAIVDAVNVLQTLIV